MQTHTRKKTFTKNGILTLYLCDILTSIKLDVYTLCSQLANPSKTEGKVSEMNNEPQQHKAFRR